MIKVKNINGSPETTPDTNGGVYSDSEFFYFFETEHEFNEFIAALPVVWDKKTYCRQIEAAVDSIVSAKLLQLNYTNFNGEPSIGDVAAGIADTQAGWHLEAIEVNKWYSSVYYCMYLHLAEVTEYTAMPVEQFIVTLPIFTYG